VKFDELTILNTNKVLFELGCERSVNLLLHARCLHGHSVTPMTGGPATCLACTLFSSDVQRISLALFV
jgi:hypothetical protein